jgi:GAF domain-containing protein
MHNELVINKQASGEKIYEQLLPQLDSLINSEEPIISNLSNISAALKQALPKVSWAGFYLFKDNKLFLGPFQGNTACTVIELGNGVCGTSAARQETIIVEDVDKFPGHIVCDSGSKSEIVVPLISGENIFGVLDLDSHNYSSFNDVDKKYLEKICSVICDKLNFTQFEIR